ncbi:hypothetical protein GGR57DRAFT_508891 [Xylariaceae sp. FL1272]|nr:hypothetical protein GGR57DRAFT_508891 [Xylariaceae sp. FL1272]
MEPPENPSLDENERLEQATLAALKAMKLSDLCLGPQEQKAAFAARMMTRWQAMPPEHLPDLRRAFYSKGEPLVIETQAEDPIPITNASHMKLSDSREVYAEHQTEHEILNTSLDAPDLSQTSRSPVAEEKLPIEGFASRHGLAAETSSIHDSPHGVARASQQMTTEKVPEPWKDIDELTYGSEYQDNQLTDTGFPDLDFPALLESVDQSTFYRIPNLDLEFDSYFEAYQISQTGAAISNTTVTAEMMQLGYDSHNLECHEFFEMYK